MPDLRGKYHLTQSLLSSWLWIDRKEDGYADFLKALKGIRTPDNEAMERGRKYEGAVNRVLDGMNPEEAAAAVGAPDKWLPLIEVTARYLTGAQKQVEIMKEITVAGMTFELDGIMDFVREGIIYDTKFTNEYRLNKYLRSPQHPLYFCLCPDAYEFEYIICDGKDLYSEVYRREDTEPVESIISGFMLFLDRMNLMPVFRKYWNLTAYYRRKINQEEDNNGIQQLQLR